MKLNVAVAFLPTRWRERYVDEIEALLSHSHHPVSDLLDLVKPAGRWYMEEAMKDIWKVSSIVLAIVSVFAAGYATSDLETALENYQGTGGAPHLCSGC